MRRGLNYTWRVGLAGVVCTFVSMVSYRLLDRYQDMPDSELPFPQMAGVLLVVGLLTAGALTCPTVRSRWSGTQLVVAIFVAMFGLRTFVNIAQSWLLIPKLMPFPYAALLSAHGFLSSVLSAFAIVLIMGRLHPPGLVAESSRLHLAPLEWLWKLAVCAAALVGMLVVVKRGLTPSDLTEFYKRMGVAPLWQFAIFEAGRALLLVAFVLPVIKMTKGGRLEAALTTALMMSVLCSVSVGIIPWSAEGSDRARCFWMIQEAVTLFLYGLLVGYLFSRRPTVR